jgi:hypothetical protein
MDKLTEPLKYMVFRIPESLKMSFRVALMKHRVDVQHTLEAFAETFIAYDQGEKQSDAMKAILKRAQILSNGVKT